MDVFGALVLGFLQGVLEWLPVSSSGQSMLVLLDFFGLSASQAYSLGLFLHLGTASAVLVKYRSTWLGVFGDRPLLRFLVVSTFATAVTGVASYVLLKSSIDSFPGGVLNAFIGGLLVLTGVVLYLGSRHSLGERMLGSLSDSEAALTGFVQGFASLPGISRSGVTVTTLALSGVKKEEALRISFLMSVPAALGAVGLEIMTEGVSQLSTTPILAALSASFIFGYLGMEALIRFAHKVRFDVFCVLFGAVAVVLSL